MTNFGGTVVAQAARIFEDELRAELRAKFMALAESDIEFAIDEIVQRMNIVTNGGPDQFRLEYPVTFSYRSLK